MCRNEKCGADIHSVRSPLHGFRFHDCRHHAITELCEAQANDSIIREIAGHVSPKMLAHYSHVRMDAKRKVIARLATGSSGGGYGTNHDTKSGSEGVPTPQLTEKNGGDDGTRTRGLCRDRAAF